MTRIPNTPSWQARLDYRPDIEWGRAKAEYIAQFPYSIKLKFGPSHGDEFRDFDIWCHRHLGNKFKDWFIISAGKGVYTLYSRDNKWATFLILTYVDNLVD
jgi:hypothetical protein